MVKLTAERVSLEQLRDGLGISQEELADVMDVQQPAISKLVRRPDMKVSTSRDLVAAMGGELHITPAFPDRSVEIGNLTASTACHRGIPRRRSTNGKVIHCGLDPSMATARALARPNRDFLSQ